MCFLAPNGALVRKSYWKSPLCFDNQVSYLFQLNTWSKLLKTETIICKSPLLFLMVSHPARSL